MNNSSAAGKVVLITGGTKGLGRALSLAFAESGYEVIATYRSDERSAASIESEFLRLGLPGAFIKQDITDGRDSPELERIVQSHNGKSFTLIANASVPFIPKPLHLNEWDEISRLIDVNVKGTFLLFKRLLPSLMKSRNGTFISVLSSALNPPAKGFASYLVAKSALDGLTRSIAAEYCSRGLRVFSVSPGFMETSLTEDWSEHLKAMMRNSNGSASRPEDMAEAILALAKDPATKGEGENYLLRGTNVAGAI